MKSIHRLILGLSCMFWFLAVSAQQTVKLYGIIQDRETGEALVGASVFIKNSEKGVISNLDGSFEIDFPETGGVLVVKYVGYLTKEISIKGQRQIIISLEKDVAKLEEVVIVGYGTQKKSDLTGASVSIKTKELTRLPVATIDQALQGQAAGVSITNTESSPGASAVIRIRGNTTISGGGNPLIVVNGVRGVDLSNIHPNDISSMEVLKDASATAIYGSQGANGVILITTKNSFNTKPTVQYDGYASVQTIRKKLELMSPFEYARNVNRYNIANGNPLVYSFEDLQKFKNGTAGTNWQDQIFRIGISQNHHLTVSGGNEDIKYFISGDYTNTLGIVKNSNLDRYRLTPYFSFKVSNKLKIELNAFALYSKENQIQQFSRDAQGSPIYAAQIFSPTKPVYMPDGSYSQPGGGVGPNTEYNPLALALEPVREVIGRQLRLSPYIEYKIIPGLTASTSLTYDSYSGELNTYYNEKINLSGGINSRSAGVTRNNTTTLQNTNILTYEKGFSQHNIKVTGVYEQIYTTFNTLYAGGNNFPNNIIKYNALQLAQNIAIPYSERRDTYISSFMGRANYSFDDRYALTLTARSDASSVFANNNKYAFFPAAGVSWNVSNESFMKNLTVINNLKLRLSYGIVGNSAIRPYQSLAQFAPTTFSFNGSSISQGAFLSPSISNPNLRWESTAQTDIGIDISLMKSRIDLTVDVYEKLTSDLLFQRQILQSSGFQTQLVNAGKIENRGLEITLSVKPVQTDSFNWSSGINVTINRNKVLSLDEGKKELPFADAGLPGFNRTIYLQVGEPLGLVKGYQYAGVWKTSEKEQAAKYGSIPGDSKFVDQNNDKTYDEKDIVPIARSQPDFTFGWTNAISYKNFELNMLINGSYGNQLYNIGRQIQETNLTGTSRNLLKAWSPQNENTDIPSQTDKNAGIRNSSRWTEDASYLRLKNLSLAYNLPSEKIKKVLNVDKIRIYATASNLLTLTRYSGFDPEANNAIFSPAFGKTGSYGALKGIDLASYPSQRTYTLGLNITF